MAKKRKKKKDLPLELQVGNYDLYAARFRNSAGAMGDKRKKRTRSKERKQIQEGIREYYDGK